MLGARGRASRRYVGVPTGVVDKPNGVDVVVCQRARRDEGPVFAMKEAGLPRLGGVRRDATHAVEAALAEELLSRVGAPEDDVVGLGDPTQRADVGAVQGVTAGVGEDNGLGQKARRARQDVRRYPGQGCDG